MRPSSALGAESSFGETSHTVEDGLDCRLARGADMARRVISSLLLVLFIFDGALMAASEFPLASEAAWVYEGKVSWIAEGGDLREKRVR